MSERPRTMTADVWLIYFEDDTAEAEVFTGEGAEATARERFKALSDNWNCWLLTNAAHDSNEQTIRELQDRLEILTEPGTPIAIISAMFDYAIAECGHQKHGFRHAFSTIIRTIKELREQLAQSQSLMGAAVEGKSAAEQRLSAVCSERDELRSQCDLLQSQLDNTRRDLAEGNRQNAKMLEQFRADQQAIQRLDSALLAARDESRSQFRRERELSDQLAEALERTKDRLLPPGSYFEIDAALAQHAAMRAKPDRS